MLLLIDLRRTGQKFFGAATPDIAFEGSIGIEEVAQEEIEAGEVNLALLEHESELALLRKMGQLPEVIELAATTLAPHHLPYYAQEVASAFHAFYRDCRVLSDDIPLTQARLALVRACQIVLANSLKLIGVSTPEKM